MRASPRENSGMVTFSGRFDGGLASGSGVASNGMLYVFTRTATGDYTINFDSALIPVSVISSSHTGYSPIISSGAGMARFQSYNTAAALANGVMEFTITARKSV